MALQRLFARAGGEAQRELRRKEREIAEPLRADIEGLAVARIRRVGPKWSRMRIGVTQKEVYIVPRQRGVKGRGFNNRRRPNFAVLMQERAMEPALDRNRASIEREVEGLLDELAVKWSA